MVIPWNVESLRNLLGRLSSMATGNSIPPSITIFPLARRVLTASILARPPIASTYFAMASSVFLGSSPAHTGDVRKTKGKVNNVTRRIIGFSSRARVTANADGFSRTRAAQASQRCPNLSPASGPSTGGDDLSVFRKPTMPALANAPAQGHGWRPPNPREGASERTPQCDMS